MPILTKTDITGVTAYIGVNANRGAGLETAPIERALLTLDGLEGEAHGGPTRAACVRFREQYPKGVELRNARQLTIVAAEELAEIGALMGLGEPIRPEWIGANLMLEGVPRLTLLPPSARLIFESGAGLVVDLENQPCHLADKAIKAHRPELTALFQHQARGKRGVTAWVERAGEIALGARCRLHLPPQRIYAPGAAD